MTFNDILLYSLINTLQLPSETLPPEAVGNKYRDQEVDNMQRVRDLGILGSWVLYLPNAVTL